MPASTPISGGVGPKAQQVAPLRAAVCIGNQGLSAVSGLDTSVLLRYLIQDDQEQANLATKFVETLTEHNKGFIAIIVLIELNWVLQRCYGLEQPAVMGHFENLLRAEEFAIEQQAVVSMAINDTRQHDADFADAIIFQVGKANGCGQPVTFDKGALRVGMRLM